MRDFLDVLTLHKKFEFPCSEFPAAPEESIFKFREHFLHEELDEYHIAFGHRNLVGVVDALLDFVYVACGTALFVGAPRNGPSGHWPSFRTICQQLMSHNIIDDQHSPPTFLSESLHLYTVHAMRSRVISFNHAYMAAKNGDDEQDMVLFLMLHALKQCVEEAYKAAAMMSVPWEKCWTHVAEANLKKRPGVVEKRKAKYDLVKPAGWKAPEAGIANELMMEGWRIPAEMEIDNCSGKVRMIDFDYRSDPSNQPRNI